MRRIGLLFGIFAAFVIVIAGIGLVIFLIIYPDVEPPADLTIPTTPDRIARGAYLANHVVVCIDCHSTRDWDYYAGPIMPDTEGRGGEVFGPGDGLPGVFYAPNITSKHIGHWTDGEIARAITSGVSRDGGALFPIMPYPAYNNLSEADLHAIIAYIRTLRPVASTIPERSLDFPMGLIVRTMPMSYTPAVQPDPKNILAYGAYLTTIAGCVECHTPKDQGTDIPGMALGGGFEFPLPRGGVVRSSNITPDPATGIGSWRKKDFIARFKQYEVMDRQKLRVLKGGNNTVMPWTMYAGMTETDLGAIYSYLQTVTPVRNMVNTHP